MTYLTDETMDEMSDDLDRAGAAPEATDEVATTSLSDQIWAVHTKLVTCNYPLPCRECGKPLSQLTETLLAPDFSFLGGDVTFSGKGDCEDCGESSGEVEIPPVYLVSTLTLAINSIDEAPF